MVNEKTGRVYEVCASARRGVKKKRVRSALLIDGHGIEGDAHAGSGKRQVSLLAVEKIREINEQKNVGAAPGDFAENITTEGIDWSSVPVGAVVRVGAARLRIVERGKPEHGPGDYSFKGLAPLAREGVFAEVIDGGYIDTGDLIRMED